MFIDQEESLMKRVSVRALLSFLVLLGLSAAARAQAPRTWVSGVGEDVNPCSRTAPCKTFAGAISKTSAGGQINVLDAGAYGAVTITKAITIDASGNFAGVLATLGSNAITVNAGANDIVVLRGLTVDGNGTGANGIRFLAGAALYVENCVIRAFRANTAGNGHGITFIPAAAAELYVTDTVISDNGTGSNGGGILIKPTGTGSTKSVFNRVEIVNNIFGLRVDGAASTGANTATVKHSSASGNTNASIIAVSNGASTQVMVHGSTLSGNGFGPRADGSNAIFRFGGSIVTGNGTGVSAVNTGQVLSYGDNQVDGNTAVGIAPSVIPHT